MKKSLDEVDGYTTNTKYDIGSAWPGVLTMLVNITGVLTMLVNMTGVLTMLAKLQVY